MPMPSIKATVTGVAGIRSILLELEGKKFRKAARVAIGDCTKIILAAAKANVPTRTGMLKKSLGRKVAAKKGGGGYVGIVGPRKDISDKTRAKQQKEFDAGERKRAPGKARFKKAVKYKGREIVVNPVKYAHLVEYGTAAHGPKGKKVLSDGADVFGTRTAGAAPRPFLRPAWETSKAGCEAIIAAAFRLAVAKAGG